MYAVLQEHEVIDYFESKELADQCAFNEWEQGRTYNLYVVEIVGNWENKQ